MVYLCSATEKPRYLLRRLTNDGVMATRQPIRWLFLGRDYWRLMEWESALGPAFERINYAEQLQALAMEWRQPYLDWIARMGAQNDSLEWWTSRIAERNTLLDSLYHGICYLKIGLTYALQASGPLVIIAEKAAVLRTIADYQGLKGHTQHVRSLWTLPDSLAWVLRLAYRWSRYFVDGVLALRDARATCRGATGAPNTTSKPRVIIHTCIDESYFGANGMVCDRYFPGLADELRRKGYEVITLPWIAQIRRSRRQAFEWFRQHPGEYLIPEDFYSFTDYVWAALVVLRQVRLPRGRHVFQPLDVTRLVREARLSQSADPTVATFVRYYRLINRWAARGLKVDIFIDMFENMSVEKPQVLAFQKWMPEVMTVGFQHYIALPPLMLCLFSNPEESACAPHPKVIVCNSPVTVKQLTEAGFPARKLRIGPSLRYSHLAALERVRIRESNTVVVVVSLDSMAARELLVKLLKAFPIDEGIRFWIKPHPMMSANEFRRMLDGHLLPDHMVVVDGPIHNWLARAACAVVIATTSALEVAMAAVPLVIVGRETDFDINPLAWFSELDGPVHSPEEIRSQVLKKLSWSAEDWQTLEDWAQRMRRECYSPATETTLSAFVRPTS